MLQICGISFILGFTFASIAVFLNLTLLHIPHRYADSLFLLSVSPWTSNNSGMPEYCPVSFLWTSLHHTTAGTTDDWTAFSAICYHAFLCAYFHTDCFLVGCVAVLVFFFFLSCMQREQLGKAFFSMSTRIVSILHNLSPFSVSLH